MTKVYEQIARSFDAALRCDKTDNREWSAKHRETIDSIVRNELPSGSGWDNGTKFDYDASTPDKLVFYGGYHHMDDGGMYDGWTEHTVTVKPSLMFGISITVSGRNRNDIKDYIADLFQHALTQEAR